MRALRKRWRTNGDEKYIMKASEARELAMRPSVQDQMKLDTIYGEIKQRAENGYYFAELSKDLFPCKVIDILKADGFLLLKLFQMMILIGIL